jgi:hypothetical protein
MTHTAGHGTVVITGVYSQNNLQMEQLHRKYILFLQPIQTSRYNTAQTIASTLSIGFQ